MVAGVRGAFQVASGALLWGTIGLAYSFVHEAGILAVSSLRAAIATCALLAYMACTRRLSALKRLAEPRILITCLFGAVAVTTFQVCLFAAIRSAGVAMATLLAIGSAPVFTGVFSILRKQRPEPGWLLATILGIAGLGLICLPSGTAAAIPLPGVIYALAAGTAYSASTIAAKSLTTAGIQPQAVTTAYFTGAALMLSPAAAITGGTIELSSPSEFLAIAWLGIMATSVAYCLYVSGLSEVTAPSAALLGLAEPLTAAAIGFALLKEEASTAGILGMTLITSGITASVLSAWVRSRREISQQDFTTGHS
ncbi:DMT family transporter [Streptomyces sp. NBC_00233]|uniref:DMT family transporter n=1 Tax=Streptomyces sp. NBC_00233 TaxID=2975686 RepID=UPI0022528066|nr:EamA family transporter [Streptomyces sp. NBC_00233]MCX5231457.1 DMT family transporter [Streptomyces sp. NBC_00233]MCX5233021.1 DMT family transporter [Streptomyces sp. NBC_00233]